MKNLIISQKGIVGFALLVIAMVAGLLAWIADTRYREFSVYQQRAMRSSVNGTAGEIGIFLNELRRSTHLFADSKSDLLEKLAANPNDMKLHQQVAEAVHAHFPDSFAFTLADLDGNPLMEDFDGLTGEVCLRDLHKFATDRAHSRVYIHPHPSAYHFDTMVDWERGGEKRGILFISFTADILARIIQNGQLPEHTLYLLHKDIPGLIEVAASGARISMKREFRLSAEEMKQIGYAQDIKETFWNLADLPAVGLFENMRKRLFQESLLILGLFSVVCMAILVALARTTTRKRRIEYLYTHDALTSLPNRFYLLERLQQLIASGQKKPVRFALLMIDLGDFKRSSGNFFDSHQEPQFLKQATAQLQQVVSAGDTVARLASHEFAIILLEATLEKAGEVAEKIVENLKIPHPDSGVSAPETAVGIAIFPDHGEDFETLTQRAYFAMHTAKQSKTRWVIT